MEYIVFEKKNIFMLFYLRRIVPNWNVKVFSLGTRCLVNTYNIYVYIWVPTYFTLLPLQLDVGLK